MREQDNKRVDPVERTTDPFLREIRIENQILMDKKRNRELGWELISLCFSFLRDQDRGN